MDRAAIPITATRLTAVKTNICRRSPRSVCLVIVAPSMYASGTLCVLSCIVLPHSGLSGRAKCILYAAFVSARPQAPSPTSGAHPLDRRNHLEPRAVALQALALLLDPPFIDIPEKP